MKITPQLLRGILIRTIFVLVFLAILVSIIAFARGYRFNFKDGTVTSTGILSVTSSPRPAQVYIDGELKGVTDLNLTLPHGKYTVEIKKDGYTELKKTINLKGEVVNSINALLFPKNPSLSPLTNLGIVKAIPVNGTDRVILFTDNNDPLKDGIYLFESTKKTISIFPPLKLLLLKSLLPPEADMKNAELYFSPDNREGIISFTNEQGEATAYLISLDDLNEDLFDVTDSKQTVITAWQQKKEQDLFKIIETFKPEIRKVASDSFRVIAFSPDETKVMYQARQNFTVPTVIKPPIIGANQTPEVRTIEQDKLYVYDRKEDKNYILDVPLKVNELVSDSGTLQVVPDTVAVDDDIRTHIQGFLRWFPDSGHLVIKDDTEIDIMSYDGTNRITVYSGPFQKDFYAIAPDWNLLILANLNPQNNEFGDLYSIGIR